MRLLMTCFDIKDYGGIVNHVELLIKGFKELGHTCDFVILRNTKRAVHQNKPLSETNGTYVSTVTNQANAMNGWYGANVIGYASKEGRRAWRKLAERYDAIIHQLPVPKADPEGNWRKIYNVDVPQIAIAHDAHFREMYPHMIDIADRLQAVSVTNHAGYCALEPLPVARCFIGAPHVPRDWDAMPAWKHRDLRFVSAHIWKPWKHMEQIVKAIPYLPKSVHAVMGGNGIEAKYMRSKEKCKDKYKGIWNRALKAGMDYRWLMTPQELAKEYRNARIMVDMSFSKKFYRYGNHFNRSTIEAYNGGCVPLVTSENMTEQDPPVALFMAGITHIEVPHEHAPKQLAQWITDAASINPTKAEEVVQNGRDILLKHFHYVNSAQGFIDLIKGKKKVGIYQMLEKGKLTKQIKEARDAHIHSIKRQG